MAYVFSILMGLAAYSCVSTGLVLMKKGIGWIGWRGERTGIYYRNLLWWVGGFVIMNIYGVPSAVALKHLPPHVVAAFAGWGIIFLVFLSRVLLGEPIFRSDAVFSLFIVMGIVLISVFEPPASTPEINITGLAILGLLPVVLFLSGLPAPLSKRIKTVIFGSVSGISAGLMVVFLRLLVLLYGYKVALYFTSPYLYGYIVSALLSFIALQAACKNGPMMMIGPMQYSANITYPLLGTLVVFGRSLHWIQLLSAVLIVYSVIGILKKR